MERKKEDEKITSGESSLVIIKSDNICPQGRHPEDILSNLCGNDFCFDGVQCGCMESFLQSLKLCDQQLQREICRCKARELEKFTGIDWNGNMPLWWMGRKLNRHSIEYTDFLCNAYKAMFLWCARFRDALMSTEGKQLLYNSGNTNSNKSILTDEEFCTILVTVREKNSEDYKKYIYPRRWPNSYGVDEDYEF